MKRVPIRSLDTGTFFKFSSKSKNYFIILDNNEEETIYRSVKWWGAFIKFKINHWRASATQVTIQKKTSNMSTENQEQNEQENSARKDADIIREQLKEESESVKRQIVDACNKLRAKAKENNINLIWEFVSLQEQSSDVRNSNRRTEAIKINMAIKIIILEEVRPQFSHEVNQFSRVIAAINYAEALINDIIEQKAFLETNPNFFEALRWQMSEKYFI